MTSEHFWGKHICGQLLIVSCGQSFAGDMCGTINFGACRNVLGHRKTKQKWVEVKGSKQQKETE